MTDRARRSTTDAAAAVQEITRRAGHEIRNALNGVAVNSEVVRSRATGLEKSDDIVAFAERAVLQVAVANALTDGLLALVGCVLTAQADGTLRLIPGHGARTQIELMIYGARAESLVFDIKRFGHMIGVGVEEHGERVILSLSLEGKSHSKE